ncbi:hypothetical protein [Nocardioides jishulii]|uniref:Uncharacterized protein n=1 Tax=Nocardioides jishulii TaxID=2575440 RepID=A0A4U2YLH1_9ACTN|nr:hypothetical protein [Nocardioides jishulii]QCX26952.1 hypothetical protein FCL41_04960 [Nocardioides jishulii]TKI61435.1 hypothetical protein FC770_11595 [Nocardioides jishulii]
MEAVSTVAIGIDLDLMPSNEGGRQTPLLGGYAAKDRFTYRPNWGLPGWSDGDQTAGPVLGFSRTNVLPGEHVRAILLPLFIDHAPEWLDIVNWTKADHTQSFHPNETGHAHYAWAFNSLAVEKLK